MRKPNTSGCSDLLVMHREELRVGKRRLISTNVTAQTRDCNLQRNFSALVGSMLALRVS